jgi:hypothetical protein
LGNVQRLFKKAILEVLVAIFPAGNSFILDRSRALVSCGLAGDFGPFSVGRGLDDKRFGRIKSLDDEALMEEKRTQFPFHFLSSQVSIHVHLGVSALSWERTLAHLHVSVSFLFVSRTVLP